MHRDNDRYKLFTRRTALLAGGKLLLLSAIAGRMYYLQVVEAQRYKTLADENRINMRLLPPPRGRILDRFGLPMAVNQQNYRVILISEQAKDIPGVLDNLGQIIRLSDADKRRILRETRRKRSFVPVTVRENLTWEEVAAVEVNTPDLPGITIDVGESRFYPYPGESAHALGYVSIPNEDELTGDPLLELPGFRIGKAGVEKVHDVVLRGVGGTSQVEVNAFGRVIRELSRQDGQAGADVRLTIDLGLQRFTAQRLGEESASAVVLDIANGDVLAMTSTPSFDSNAFNKGLSGREWRALTTNPRSPLINKSIAGQYAPGSTFKVCVALAALEKGVVTPQQRFVCPGHLELGNMRFHCWKKEGHGWMDMEAGIAHSCDVYFYEVARRVGIERIAAMARRLGLGSATGLDLPGEQNGLVPDREWKHAALKSPWQQGETLITGIGQGYLLTTPLQLALMTARIANGNLAIVPRLTRGIATLRGEQPRRGTVVEPLNIAPAHLALIRRGMTIVCNEPFGTGFRSRITEAGYEMAGKTGTVQVRRISKAERETGVKKNEDLPWEQRDHALFIGFAPHRAPRYACAVVVEHGGSGSKMAAPIARDVLLAAQKRGSGGEDRAGPVAETPPDSAGGSRPEGRS